jgi:arylsulfatase
MKRLNENAVLTTKNKSYTITADVTVPDGGADGVIFAQGGSTGGLAVAMMRQ